MTSNTVCPLCREAGGEIVYRHDRYRVVLVDDANYPGFCRVIWNDHTQEMTDLETSDRERLMAVVWQIETALRDVMQPDKINLASFGNMVPHLHWHVIARYADDMHFPNPVWGAAERTSPSVHTTARAALLPELRKVIVQQLQSSQTDTHA
jgi:diadenosine tetraphosphate (Ap4A) HIT family hydrolase